MRLEATGRALLERVLPGMYRRQVEIMGDLTPDEQRELARLLRKVRADPVRAGPDRTAVRVTGTE